MVITKSSPVTHREFSWGKIIFSSKKHITVETPTVTIVFHNFGAPKKDYGRSWRLFRQELRRKNLQGLNDVYKYANHFEILHYTKNYRLKGRK